MMQQVMNADYEQLFSKFNYLVGCGVIGLGGAYFIFNSSLINPFSWLYPIYFVLFGFMIFSAQTRYGIIERNFSFLEYPLGRGIFYIYTGTLCFNFEQPDSSDAITSLISWIGFVCLAVLGLFYILKGLFTKQNAQIGTIIKDNEPLIQA